MYITITYVYEKDGVIGYACGYKPDGTIIEERTVLNPEATFELERISDKERLSAVWLKDGDKQENYIEVPLEEDSDKEIREDNIV